MKAPENPGDIKSGAVIDKSVAEYLFRSGFDSLDKLTTVYFTSRSDTPDLIIKSIETQLDRLKSDESLELLCKKIDLLYDGILSRIKSEIPKMKTADIYFIALKLAGFSPKSICFFLDITPTNYYTKWQRIRNRLAESDITTTHFDTFK